MTIAPEQKTVRMTIAHWKGAFFKALNRSGWSDDRTD